jgi:hypothetical protein
MSRSDRCCHVPEMIPMPAMVATPLRLSDAPQTSATADQSGIARITSAVRQPIRPGLHRDQLRRRSWIVFTGSTAAKVRPRCPLRSVRLLVNKAMSRMTPYCGSTSPLYGRIELSYWTGMTLKRLGLPLPRVLTRRGVLGDTQNSLLQGRRSFR